MQRLEPGVDPHLPQPFALFLQAHHLGPVRDGDRLEQLEIDMGGQISLARMGEDIDPLVRLQRLQSGAGAQLARPVVDDQRRAALFLQAPGDLGHQRGSGRAGLDHRALRGAAPARRDEVIHALGPGLEDEVLALQPHQPLEPAIGAAHQLVHRQGIEELVGDDEQRGILGQGGKIVVVVAGGEGLALEPPQRRRGLDEMDLRGKAIATGAAERVPGERAAPRAKLDIVDVLAALHPHPQVSQPQADEFAEHLADLGRGDEVALGAERIAAGIVARVAFAHELGQADRAGLADEAPEALADIARGARGKLGLAFGRLPCGFGCGVLGGAAGLFLGLAARGLCGLGAGAFLGSARFCCAAGGLLGFLLLPRFLGSARLSRAPGGLAGCGLGLGLGLAAGLLLGGLARPGLGFGPGPGFGLGLGARLGGGFRAAPFFLGGACPGGGFGLLARARLGFAARLGLGRGLGLGRSLCRAPGALFGKGALLGLLALACFLGGPCARLGGGACRSLCRGLLARPFGGDRLRARLALGPGARGGLGLVCLARGGRRGGRRGRLSRRVDQPERAAPRARALVQARACGPAVSGLLRSA